MSIVNKYVEITNLTHTVGQARTLSLAGSRTIEKFGRAHYSVEPYTTLTLDLFLIQYDELFIDTLCNMIDSGEAQVKIDGSIYASSVVGLLKYGSSGVGSLTIKNEGTTIETGAKTLNFVGADIEAYAMGGNVVMITSPAISFSDYYNTGSATVASISTTSRRVAAPTTEGNPYKIGSWTAGTLNPCARIATGVIDFNTPATCSFLTNSTTVSVYVYDADGSTILETKTTAPITGAGSWSSTNITISVTGWTTEGPRYAGNIDVSINIANILPNGGRFSCVIVHHNSGTDYTKSQTALFYDVDANAATLSGVTIGETGGLAVIKYLSGVKYYDIGSGFTVNIADMDYLNGNSYPTYQATLQGSVYGLSTLSLSGAALTGWTNAYDDVNDSFNMTTWGLSATNYRYIGTTAKVSARTEDWTSGSWVDSADASILIDTYSSESTSLAEYFTDETYRRTSAGAVWDSTQSLVAYDGGTGAQVIGGILRVPGVNYSTYSPSGSPNYSALVAPKNYYRRIIDVSGLVRNSASLAISGFTLADLTSSKVELWIDIPTRFTSPCYAHTASTFNFATFSGNNDPIRLLSSTSGVINVSFGALGLTAGQTYFILRIVINDASIQPTSVIVSW